MNKISYRSELAFVGKIGLLAIVIILASSALLLARPAHAATDPRTPPRDIRVGMTPASAAVVVPEAFPFGYGGGPAKDVIPPTIRNLLANLKASLQSLISGIFASL